MKNFQIERRNNYFANSTFFRLFQLPLVKSGISTGAQQKETNALQQSIQTTATHLQTLVIALGQ